jgi:glycosyltransferase involved in cell wall biosynthesis
MIMPVSIVIAVRNGARYIAEAIESARVPEVAEILVVDDGSTDATRDIVNGLADPRVRLLSSAASGVSAARNTGARAATGEWLMFLDADDRLRPGAIAALLAAAQTASAAIAVYGDYDRIDPEGRAIGMRRAWRGRAKPSGRILERLVAGNFIVNGGVMIVRAQAFAACAGFDETLRFCEDWHCWCRLAALGDIHYAAVHVLDYRVHDAGTMSARARSPADFLPAAERVFTDPAIVAKLPKASLLSLRAAAEVHLCAYAAAQAVRFHCYGQALAYTARAVAQTPRAAPGVMLKVGMAFLGM